jgi:Uma2 family endonuclease
LEERAVSEESSAIASWIQFLLWSEAIKTREARVYDQSLSYQCFGDPSLLRRPDASVIRRSRLAGLDNPGLMPIPADLAVEVLSPNDLAYKVEEKIELYLTHGFGIVWIVNPQTKIVAIYRADGTIDRLHESDEIALEGILSTFRRKVADLFALPE